MKERPILFSGPMVRVLLDGSKTQTRRILKPAPLPPVVRWVLSDHWWIPEAISDKVKQQFITTWPDALRCPHGQIGDRLWVREAWRIGAWNEDDETIAIDYLADNFARREWLDVPLDERNVFERLWIQSTDDAIKAGLETDDGGKYHWEPGQSPCRGRPSIHMPRWASRITLEITNVRVERLREISMQDVMAEGCILSTSKTEPLDYQNLWESIHSPASWNANPWVWVIEFKKINQEAP